MPPPSCISKVSGRSNYDHERETENGRSEPSNQGDRNVDKEVKSKIRSEAVGIVKSLLGPTLEDAVLRTLEFGKSLIQKPEPGSDAASKDKKEIRAVKKEGTEPKLRFSPGTTEQHLNVVLEERTFDRRGNKSFAECKKRNSFAAKLDRKAKSSSRRLSTVSKIRSLDSDLKKDSLSPEKIKRQLQALIQINKDEPPESIDNIFSKTPKLPMEITVMPTVCNYNETDLNHSQSSPSRGRKAYDDSISAGGGGGGGYGGYSESGATTSKTRHTVKKRPNKLPHAPEFLSNALGPTIDVAIIDNLKMMRDILKYDSGKGEGMREPAITQRMEQEIVQPVMKPHEVRLQNSEGEMAGRIEELQKRIEELESKEHFLAKQIEEEERERAEKRKAFKEEQERNKEERKKASKEEEERDRAEKKKASKEEEERDRAEKKKVSKEEEERERPEKRRTSKEEVERERAEKKKTTKAEEERERGDQRRAYKEEEERERKDQRRAYKEEEERERGDQRKAYKEEEKKQVTMSTGKQEVRYDITDAPRTNRHDSECDCPEDIRFGGFPDSPRQDRSEYDRFEAPRYEPPEGSRYDRFETSRHDLHQTSRYDRPEGSFCSRFDSLLQDRSEGIEQNRSEVSRCSRYDALTNDRSEGIEQNRSELSRCSRYDALIHDHSEGIEQNRSEASRCSRYDTLTNDRSEGIQQNRSEGSRCSQFDAPVQDRPQALLPNLSGVSRCSRFDSLLRDIPESVQSSRSGTLRQNRSDTLRRDRSETRRRDRSETRRHISPDHFETPHHDHSDPLRFYCSELPRHDSPSKTGPEKKVGTTKSHCNNGVRGCGSGVGQCEGGMGGCESSMRQCESNMRQCESGVRQCQNNVRQCESSLRQCEGNVRQCQSSMRQCEGNLRQCEGNMRQCEGNVRQCEGKMRQCEGNLRQCEGNMKQCENNVRRCESTLKEWETKFETLRARVASEEEKLANLKAQYDTYKKELSVVRQQKEPGKAPPPPPPPPPSSAAQQQQNNKCLLDAWDVFASRACHTKLPSFSRTANLERKQFKPQPQATGKLHCCFPSVMAAGPKKGRSRSAGESGNFQGSQSDLATDHMCESPSRIKSKIRSGDIQFPIQRDIQCGLHQLLKTCCCSTTKPPPKSPISLAASEEEMKKKTSSQKAPSFSRAVVDLPHRLMKKASEKKMVSRSKSDTAVKRDKNSRIVKVLWAITRINIFQNNARTYEIMDATPCPPACPPVKTEGIFVVKCPQKKPSRSPSRRKYNTGH